MSDVQIICTMHCWFVHSVSWDVFSKRKANLRQHMLTSASFTQGKSIVLRTET